MYVKYRHNFLNVTDNEFSSRAGANQLRWETDDSIAPFVSRRLYRDVCIATFVSRPIGVETHESTVRREAPHSDFRGTYLLYRESKIWSGRALASEASQCSMSTTFLRA